MRRRAGGPARLSLEVSLAVRVALGSCVASSLVLVKPLKDLFSEETQPLLQNAAVVAIFCAGGSLEETVKLSAETVAGTFGAVFGTAAGCWLGGLGTVRVDCWLSLLVPVEATLLAGAICLLPVADNVKMTMVGLMSYFTISIFSDSQVPVAQLCGEYVAMTFCGTLCIVLAYMVRVPWLADSNALQSAASAFEDVADGCAELITEATLAFLCTGAGDAWRAMALHRTRVVEARLVEARRAVGFRNWHPRVIVKRMSRSGRTAQAAWMARREAAFANAASALDTCRLLCELAVQAQAGATGFEAVAVRERTADRLARVAEAAAALLRDSARANFQGSRAGHGHQPLEEPGDPAGRTQRRAVHVAAKKALRNSSAAARELLLLSTYGGASDDAGGADDDANPARASLLQMSRSELAGARSDMAAFLFLVHALAADLLRSEADAAREQATLQRAATAPIPGGARWRLPRVDEEADDADNGSIGGESCCTESLHSGFGSLHAPLVKRAAPSVGGETVSSHGAAARVQELARRWLSCLSSRCAPLCACAAHVAAATRMRWRIALKVMLSFLPACLASIYLFELDSTTVATVAYVCSYGSQHCGSSLRRVALRGVGIAAGATVGSAIQNMILRLHQAIGVSWWGFVSCSAANALIASCWVGFVMLISFRGGPYSYAGFCSAFVSFKFTLAIGDSADLSSIVAFNMFACLLVAAVELGVMPMHADTMLRSRLAAATAGSLAALSALVTSSSENVAITPRLARDVLQYVGASAAEHRCIAGEADPMLRTLRAAGGAAAPQRLSSRGQPEDQRDRAKTIGAVGDLKTLGDLPDLTERIKEAGFYEHYLSWRDGYMRWRGGSADGSHGEIASGAPQKGAAAAPSPADPPADEQAHAPGGSEAHQNAAIVAAAFEPALSGASVGLAALDPFAAVTLPLDQGSPSEAACRSDMGPSAGLSGLADGILLTRGAPVLAEGIAGAEAQLEGPAQAGPAQLDPESAACMPLLAELARSRPHASGGASGGTCTGDGPPPRQISSVKSRELSVESLASATAQELDLQASGLALAATVSLADVQVLLDEIGSALAPARGLASQATDRLDGETVDANAWCSLAAAIGMLRLRLSLLARVALRLRHGVGVAELLGGTGQEKAAAQLVAACSVALAAATSAIAGGAAPLPRVAAQLERNLKASAATLVRALAWRSIQHVPAHGGGRGVAAEVLASTAGSTLVGLLRGSAEVLSWAVVLAGSHAEAPVGAVASEPRAPRASRGSSLTGALESELPDLTDRLKEAGKFEEYEKWRDGYMRWRGGGAAGAKGQIVKTTIT
ncbi:unnamed protein product [Prorocentrum cordatum]|uniref:Uncharacterized protein n=1 Tax=Prorocentrum cordatum TaxID=2364126 RepID=A0ABN9PJI0_9DINO|nr:unnamed protein product [Polarella glacialis]